MDFAHEQQFTAKKAGGIGVVVLAHALLVGGLVYGLHTTFVTPTAEPPVVVLPPLTPKVRPETPVEVNKLTPKTPTTITRPDLPPIESWKHEPDTLHVDGPTPGPVIQSGGPEIVDGGGGGVIPVHAGPTRVAKADFESCKPVYPRSAVLEGDEGTVRLRMEIGANGRLLSSAVVQSSGYPVLDKAALNALSKCTFEAAVQDGTPVRSTFVTDYIWSLEH